MKDFIIGLAIGLTLLWVLFRVINEKPIFRWKEPGKHYISYRTYRRLSAIAPDRWEIVDDSCLYVLYSHKEVGIKFLYMDSPISAFQLWLFIHKKEKDDNRYRDAKEREELLKSWKMDLDEFNRRKEK